VHHVQTADDLRSEWFDRAETVGITAGTSTPDSVILEVEAWLGKYNDRASSALAVVHTIQRG
jgi:4-hydroxy-3-methylbut-2-enyl diphosphate reductase